MTKYIDAIRKEFNNSDFPVFTLTDMKVLLSGKHISPAYLKMLVNHMLKSRTIRRISRGVYTFHNDIAVVGFAYRPFYYGLEDALSYRNLWTQATNPVVVTPNGVREGIRKFGGGNYMVKRVKPKLFFGFNFIRYYDFWIPVSDFEKTLIDLIYYKHGIRKEALKPLAQAIDKARLDEYLKQYSNAFKKKVYAQLEKGKDG
ncbi:MAG: type IV toxin-antitoxin system AbiEi family antitoxin domain-containing protein [Candidatus Micrarchaeales archaeon]